MSNPVGIGNTGSVNVLRHYYLMFPVNEIKIPDVNVNYVFCFHEKVKTQSVADTLQMFSTEYRRVFTSIRIFWRG